MQELHKSERGKCVQATKAEMAVVCVTKSMENTTKPPTHKSMQANQHTPQCHSIFIRPQIQHSVVLLGCQMWKTPPFNSLASFAYAQINIESRHSL